MTTNKTVPQDTTPQLTALLGQWDGDAELLKKARLELFALKIAARPNYQVKSRLAVRFKDGKPYVRMDDDPEAVDGVGDETLFYDDIIVNFEQDWMEEAEDLRGSEFLLTVIETEEFRAVAKEGVYDVWQVGVVTAEWSTDWESGYKDIDCFVYEPSVTSFTFVMSLEDWDKDWSSDELHIQTV